MRWTDLTIVAFDTETTGLFPENGDRVVEFAAIEMKVDAELNVTKVTPHAFLVNPGIPIPRESTDVTGITDEHVAGAPPFEKFAERVHGLLRSGIVVAHNISFDLRMLQMELGRCGLSWPGPPAEIDTLDLSRRFYKGEKSHKLGELTRRCDVTLVEAHRAANDAEACARCFVSMARRFGAPTDLGGLIDWADAVGDPPDTGHLLRNAARAVVFGDGPHAGEPVERHPDLLSWMTFARARAADGRWGMRYPDAVRAWAERWLRVRASGGFPANTKGFGPADWGIDTPIGSAGPLI